MSFEKLKEDIRKYYDGKLDAFGSTPQGVDWNSAESQKIRFDQLLKICDLNTEFSINDYGCGYGALAKYLLDMGRQFRYHGFDLSEKMIASAKKLYGNINHCQFDSDESQLNISDG